MYKSNITIEQYQLLHNLLPVVKRTKPPKYSKHQIINAMLYILKNGSQWRDLPKDFGMSWQVVYYYFRLWSETGLFMKIQEILRRQYRQLIQRQNQIGSVSIIDSQATKNSCSGRNKGFCSYKLTNGIKKHVLVDSQGFCICAICTPANISDTEGLKLLIKQHINLLRELDLEKILADLGYNSKHLDQFLFEELNLFLQLSPRNKETKLDKELDKEKLETTKQSKKGFQVQPLRWKSERQFAWCDGCRRLWKNCEKLLQTTENYIYMANIRILLRRLA